MHSHQSYSSSTFLLSQYCHENLIVNYTIYYSVGHCHGTPIRRTQTHCDVGHLTFNMPTAWKTLHLPDLRLRKPYTVLPRPNAIDKWLSSNYITSPGNVFILGYRYMGDLL